MSTRMTGKVDGHGWVSLVNLMEGMYVFRSWVSEFRCRSAPLQACEDANSSIPSRNGAGRGTPLSTSLRSLFDEPYRIFQARHSTSSRLILLPANITRTLSALRI